MADLLNIYAQRVEHIAPTRWIYSWRVGSIYPTCRI